MVEEKFGYKKGDNIYVLHYNKKLKGKVVGFTNKFVKVELQTNNKIIKKKPLNISKDEIFIDFKILSIFNKIKENNGLYASLEELFVIYTKIKESYPELYLKL
jgi:hypothetical protein